MRAWLKGDVCSRSAGFLSSLLERCDFRMVTLVIHMKALANQGVPALDQHAAYSGIGGCDANRMTRLLQGKSHPAFIERQNSIFGHDFLCSQQRIDKCSAVKRQQVFDLFAYANVAHRQLK